MADLHTSSTLSTARHTLAGAAGLKPSNRLPAETQALLALALDDDGDVSALACMELRHRLDHLPAIPIADSAGNVRVVIEQEAAP